MRSMQIIEKVGRKMDKYKKMQAYLRKKRLAKQNNDIRERKINYTETAIKIDIFKKVLQIKDEMQEELKSSEKDKSKYLSEIEIIDKFFRKVIRAI